MQLIRAEGAAVQRERWGRARAPMRCDAVCREGGVTGRGVRANKGGYGRRAAARQHRQPLSGCTAGGWLAAAGCRGSLERATPAYTRDSSSVLARLPERSAL